MKRWANIANWSFGILLSIAAPSTAGTIATYTLEGVKYVEGSLTGTFDVDLQTGTISNVAILVFGGVADGQIFGCYFSSCGFFSGISASTSSDFHTAWDLVLNFERALDGYTVPIREFAFPGAVLTHPSGTQYAILPVGIVTTPQAVPLHASPALLPIALGILGLLGWRRKQYSP